MYSDLKLCCLQFKVWVKPGAEQSFLYGNHVLKSGLGRITENTMQYQGVVVYSMADVPLVSFVTMMLYCSHGRGYVCSSPLSAYCSCWGHSCWKHAWDVWHAHVVAVLSAAFVQNGPSTIFGLSRITNRFRSLSFFLLREFLNLCFISGIRCGSQVHPGVSASGSHVHCSVSPGRCWGVH